MPDLPTNTIEEITIEILAYKNNTARNIVEIGNRLIKVKELLPHGEWGKWLEEKVDFSQWTANKFMKAATEFSNYGTFNNLTQSKIFALLDLPPEERQPFAESHPVETMSTRELEKAIKAQKEAERKAQEAERRANESEAKAAESKEEINDLIQDNQRLNKQLSKTPVQEIKVEVISEEVKRKLSEFDALKTTYDQLYKKNSFLESQNKVLLGSSEKDKLEFVTKVSTFKTTVNDFLLKMGSLPFLGNEMRTSDPAAREYENGILKVEKWCREMRNTLFLQRKELIHEMEEIECQENC